MSKDQAVPGGSPPDETSEGSSVGTFVVVYSPNARDCVSWVTMQALNSDIKDIESYGRYLNDGTARSLYLLRDIEQTVLAVGTIRDDMRSFHQSVITLEKGLDKITAIIPEEGILDVYEEVQDHLVKLHGLLQKKHECAKQDRDLRDEDGVCGVYAEAIEAVCDLHSAMESFRWMVMQHNAKLDASDAGSVLSSDDEIEKFLASL